MSKSKIQTLMKKILILSLSLLLTVPSFAQKKDITLDDLWKNYLFFPKSINHFNSMNDGEHYSTIERTENGQEIVKYQFKNGDHPCNRPPWWKLCTA